MNNTRWILGWNGNYELHDYAHKIDTVLMEITEESEGTYYLICHEMEYDGVDANSKLLLDSMTIKDAKAEAEELYEEWLKEQVYHYNHRLNQLFGKTAICVLMPCTDEMYKTFKGKKEWKTRECLTLN